MAYFLLPLRPSWKAGCFYLQTKNLLWQRGVLCQPKIFAVISTLKAAGHPVNLISSQPSPSVRAGTNKSTHVHIHGRLEAQTLPDCQNIRRTISRLFLSAVLHNSRMSTNVLGMRAFNSLPWTYMVLFYGFLAPSQLRESFPIFHYWFRLHQMSALRSLALMVYKDYIHELDDK